MRGAGEPRTTFAQQVGPGSFELPRSRLAGFPDDPAPDRSDAGGVHELEASISQAAASPTGTEQARKPAVQGLPWFTLMVALWSSFVTLLAASPETLEEVWNWLEGLVLVWEILMWIVFLPWAVAYAIWESSWSLAAGADRRPPRRRPSHPVGASVQGLRWTESG
jgi:hypothetical protein